MTLLIEARGIDAAAQLLDFKGFMWLYISETRFAQLQDHFACVCCYNSQLKNIPNVDLRVFTTLLSNMKLANFGRGQFYQNNQIWLGATRESATTYESGYGPISNYARHVRDKEFPPWQLDCEHTRCHLPFF